MSDSHSLAVWLWASSLTSLSFGFLFDKMRLLPDLSLGAVVRTIQVDGQQEVGETLSTRCTVQLAKIAQEGVEVKGSLREKRGDSRPGIERGGRAGGVGPWRQKSLGSWLLAT